MPDSVDFAHYDDLSIPDLFSIDLAAVADLHAADLGAPDLAAPDLDAPLCSANTCGVHALCSAQSGVLTCTCLPGYDGDGKTCGNIDDCSPNVCAHGSTCVDGIESHTCVCSTGYAGADCSTCAPGYQDNDANGSCTVTCDLADPCPHHSLCDDRFGTATCNCTNGYEGPTCSECYWNYQDNDNNGTCEPSCKIFGPNTCHTNGTCDDSTGMVVCTCAPQYTGPSCDLCAAGYGNTFYDPVCRPNCAFWAHSCGHGHCSDSGPTIFCSCDTGYVGNDCGSCDAGYSFDGTNCVPA